MTPEELISRDFTPEFRFLVSRSSGPGGQNVNKVNSKVELRFKISESSRLSDYEKRIVLNKLQNKINKDGELIIVSQSDRSQLNNKNEVIDKFYNLISKALTIKKKRRPTSPTRSSKENRLNNKRIRSIIKKTRGRSADMD